MPCLKTLYKKQRRAIETSRRPVEANRPCRIGASASEHVGEQAKSGGGGAGANVLHVGGDSTGGRGRSGSTSCGGRTAGSGGGTRGRGRAARGGAATGRVAGGVESTAVILDAGGAVGLALGIASVLAIALSKSLLAGVVVHGADVVLKTRSATVLAGAVGVESGDVARVADRVVVAEFTTGVFLSNAPLVTLGLGDAGNVNGELSGVLGSDKSQPREREDSGGRTHLGGESGML